MGGHLFEAGYLLTISAFRMGASFRWALIRINTVIDNNYCYTYKKKLLFHWYLGLGGPSDGLLYVKAKPKRGTTSLP